MDFFNDPITRCLQRFISDSKCIMYNIIHYKCIHYKCIMYNNIDIYTQSIYTYTYIYTYKYKYVNSGGTRWKMWAK